MSARRAANMGNPSAGYGTPCNPEDEGLPDSILAAVSRCQSIAMAIEAEDFGLFLVDPSFELLQPCFDSSYPQVSPRTTFIAENGADSLAKHTRVSTAPCWWADGSMSRSECEFLRHPLTERTAELLPGVPGIAFPVFADRGRCGLVIFYGQALSLNPEQLVDAHARCFSLFHAVAALSTTPERQTNMTPRETECLKLTAEGYTSDQIAAALNLSPHTANQYLTNCTQKLNAVNRAHAVAKAIRAGLID